MPFLLKSNLDFPWGNKNPSGTKYKEVQQKYFKQLALAGKTRILLSMLLFSSPQFDGSHNLVHCSRNVPTCKCVTISFLRHHSTSWDLPILHDLPNLVWWYSVTGSALLYLFGWPQPDFDVTSIVRKAGLKLLLLFQLQFESVWNKVWSFRRGNLQPVV